MYGWRNGGDYGLLGDPGVNQAPASAAYVPYPSYFGEQLASKIVDSGGEAETAGTNYQDFHAYAVMEADGHLDLLVINTNPAASLTEQFSLTGFQPSGAAEFWQYGEAQDTAQSKSSTGTSTLSNFSATLGLTGSNFSYSFPAYSMTVIDLAPSTAPTVVSVTPEDEVGNGVAAGSTTSGANTSGQRSMETQIAVVFSEPVNLGGGGVSNLSLINNYGSGTNDGSAGTNVSAVLGAPTNPSGDGVTWIIPIVQNGASTTYSYDLANGTTASLQDGIYQLGVNAANVTATGGVAMASNFTSPMFHRLFGDMQNTDNLNNFDLADLSRGFRNVANLNGDLDFNGNGQADNLDLGAFRRNFNTSFTAPSGT